MAAASVQSHGLETVDSCGEPGHGNEVGQFRLAIKSGHRIGDQVNLAARFQGLTRTLGHPILLTEFTASKLALGPDRGKPDARRMGLDQIHLRKLQVVTVKGRQEPVGAYTVEVQSEGAGHAEREASVG